MPEPQLRQYSKWIYTGVDGKNEIHSVVFIENGEVTTWARSHGWHGPIPEFLRQFKLVEEK